ncbi:hypothetical protein KY284_028969 [Solanum tuberosum]|nr:hypothetical protein KY284_028969 [Solanum tuberosum]
MADTLFFSIKIHHGGVMKRTPEKHYVEGNIDYIDYVNANKLDLDEFKKMAEIYNEAHAVRKNIPNDNMIEIYFEHLDSYFNIEDMTSIHSSNAADNNRQQLVQENPLANDFSDSKVELTNGLLDDKHEKTAQYIVDEWEILSIEAQRKMTAPEGESDCVDSTDTKSLHSDSENEILNFPTFNPQTDGDNPILALECVFESKKDFKSAVVTHEIKNGKYIQWLKNDKERMKAVCIHSECKWEITACKMQRDTSFQIRKYIPTHNCKEWHYDNRKITASFIARKYLTEIKSNRAWSLIDFRDRVSVDLRAHVTLSQAKRAKMLAIALIDGDIKDQYKMMWDYCIEIDRTNPGSTIHMKFTENEIPNKPYRFQRIYICFAASDLDVDETGWTFMSDKQNGLIEAFNEVLPYVSHRFCARHLHNNFKRASFGGFTLKKAFWAAAKATTVKEFDACIVRRRELDSNAADWLNDKEPSQWSRSHFSSDAKCDILLNNICEVFNSMILDARDKPIVTLLEKLRYLLMARMLANREKAHKWSSNDVCPKIKDILHKNQTTAGEYIPRKSNQWNYEIIGATIHDSWAVDLENKIYSCRKWSIMGIPCKHAIAAIPAKKDIILDYVDDCYKVETYRRVYEHAILPINGPQMWAKSTKVPPLPPTIVGNKKRGRKQKARRKEADEVGASRTKMKRKQQSLDCSTCNQLGHNKKTCKYNVVSQETTSVRRGHEEAGQEKTRQEGDGQEKTLGQEEVVDIDSGWIYSQQTQS